MRVAVLVSGRIQKVNPIGIRLGIAKDWNSTWYASKNYAQLLNQDINLRKYLKKKLIILCLEPKLVLGPL